MLFVEFCGTGSDWIGNVELVEVVLNFTDSATGALEFGLIAGFVILLAPVEFGIDVFILLFELFFLSV